MESRDGAGSGGGGGSRLNGGVGGGGGAVDATTAEELTSSAFVVLGAAPTKRVHAVICRCAAKRKKVQGRSRPPSAKGADMYNKLINT